MLVECAVEEKLIIARLYAAQRLSFCFFVTIESRKSNYIYCLIFVINKLIQDLKYLLPYIT